MRAVMLCVIIEFPCLYLGLPLSVKKLTNVVLQPSVNKVADKFPSWKDALMHPSRQQILVCVLLTAIPIN